MVAEQSTATYTGKERKAKVKKENLEKGVYSSTLHIRTPYPAQGL